MEIHYKTAGALLIVLAFIHAIFPRYFSWQSELKDVSMINRQMVYIHTFFIALILLLMGLLCISSAHELITTALGRKISAGMALFWGVRLVIQFFGYSSKLWKGKRFETIVHIAASILWLYLTLLFITGSIQ